ncbi:hypothetical protein PF008_g26132 [Phytophthora fragariae]|uniref:Uncharacterized protein n=1 Tax=Phytophthora fragariae TaxID=53985 RepID=A0A6G0QHZ6_9STRA|nr:hypothetical protein PF008_g26132 [Phytophthora fragariae]
MPLVSGAEDGGDFARLLLGSGSKDGSDGFVLMPLVSGSKDGGDFVRLLLVSGAQGGEVEDWWLVFAVENKSFGRFNVTATAN